MTYPVCWEQDWCGGEWGREGEEKRENLASDVKMGMMGCSFWLCGTFLGNLYIPIRGFVSLVSVHLFSETLGLVLLDYLLVFNDHCCLEVNCCYTSLVGWGATSDENIWYNKQAVFYPGKLSNYSALRKPWVLVLIRVIKFKHMPSCYCDINIWVFNASNWLSLVLKPIKRGNTSESDRVIHYRLIWIKLNI